MMRKFTRFPGEISEHALRHVLREMSIPLHLTQCGGINQIQVPSHQFGESFLAIRLRILAKQIRV